MRRISMALMLALATLALAATAFADPGDKGKGDKDNGGKKHSKMTFTVTTTDNGSCGTPWATDVVKRTFVVKQNRDGSSTLTRRDRGTFTTLPGRSPGACDPTGRHGQTVRAGVTGKLVGFITGKVTGGTFNPKATCTGPDCGFTDVFLTTFFGANAKFSCFENSTDCKFNFNYTAAKKQELLFRHWQDKGKGAGTELKEEFKGDIADH
ncbi:MAG TPA: hypothetical protein VNI55_08985 [Gaiellaceae bacterium]|nr:hypothetical protein [Gaiellaceae bacterium]